MVNGFLELTTYPAHWVCAIFEDFVPVVVGLDGLVLGSDDTNPLFQISAQLLLDDLSAVYAGYFFCRLVPFNFFIFTTILLLFQVAHV